MFFLESLTELEEKIKDLIDPDEVVDLARELIKIPSENPFGDLEEIINFVVDYLKANGVECEIRSNKKNWPVILAELEGNKPGRTLILNGHLDVVPAGDNSRWEIAPFAGQIKSGYLYGRGASDMKAGVAGIISAFVAASKLDDLPGKLILMLVSDEESGGHWGSGWLAEKFTADGCLIAEPSRQDPTIGQKGSCWLKLITRGIPGHGSLSPAINNNAILEMNRAITALYEIWQVDWEMPAEITAILQDSKDYLQKNKGVVGVERVLDHVTVNVGVIRGGDKLNKIPDYCEAEIDLRLPFGVETAAVMDWIKAKFAEEEIKVEIEHLRWNSQANYTLPETEIVQSVLNSAKKLTGIKPTPTFQWASSDARYFRNNGIPTIQYGPAELDGIHSYNERVKVADIKNFAQAYGIIIADFLTK